MVCSSTQETGNFNIMLKDLQNIEHDITNHSRWFLEYNAYHGWLLVNDHKNKRLYLKENGTIGEELCYFNTINSAMRVLHKVVKHNIFVEDRPAIFVKLNSLDFETYN